MPEEKKIIIDEDWKSRVEAEKEELERKRNTGETGGGPTEGLESMKMPPASFEMLLTSLATEALVALGQIPHPATGKAELNLEQAKFFIDTLEILEKKTQGNLTGDEAQALQDLLHQLRIAYVNVEQAGRPS